MSPRSATAARTLRRFRGGRRPAHHLHGVHSGYVRVCGRAPGAPRGEAGRGWDGKPLEVFEPAPVH